MYRTVRSRAHAARPTRAVSSIASRLSLRLEPLEERTLMAVDLTLSAVRSIDGTGNNVANPTWGSAGSDLLRTIVASNYGDGISTPAGATLPSAREISNVVGTQTADELDARGLSAFTYAWGQFIDHDLDLTPDGGASDPIAVPTGDPQFDSNSTGTQTLGFTRSLTDPATGKSVSNPLNQVSTVTAFLDGSQVYGSDATRAAALRSFEGGHLKTSTGNLLPFNTAGLANANDTHQVPDSQLFLAGDVRANENIELSSLQILFMREHNRQADLLAKLHPQWTDEQLYQGARQIVIGEIESITFNQFLPAILGAGAITPYQGYDPSVNPTITPEFSEAAYRFGHSQLDDDVQFLNAKGGNYAFSYTMPDGTKVKINTPADIASGETGVPLLDAFFNPNMLEAPGVEGSILKYLSSDNAQAIDLPMVDAVRNVLFGAPGSGAGGQDLFALDIQRGRDVGLPTLNEARVAYGLPAVTSFSQISSDLAVQAQLKQLYGTVDKVELFVGGLAEDHVAGGSLGATFTAIIANQFERVRDGDRFWYQNQFSGLQLARLQNTTLADVIRNNTDLQNVQNNVFFFNTSIGGQVFQDSNGDGRPGRGEPGLAGREIDLLDATGKFLASTTTAADGTYHFDGLALGTYQVREVAPKGATHSTPAVQIVPLTSGVQLQNVNFGEAARSSRPTPTPPRSPHLTDVIGQWFGSNDGPGDGHGR